MCARNRDLANSAVAVSSHIPSVQPTRWFEPIPAELTNGSTASFRRERRVNGFARLAVPRNSKVLRHLWLGAAPPMFTGILLGRGPSARRTVICHFSLPPAHPARFLRLRSALRLQAPSNPPLAARLPLPGLEEADSGAIEESRTNLVDRYLKHRVADAAWQLEGSIVC